jgi:hypothetical protein
MNLVEIADVFGNRTWVNVGEGNITSVRFTPAFSTLTIHFLGNSADVSFNTKDPVPYIQALEGAVK